MSTITIHWSWVFWSVVALIVCAALWFTSRPASSLADMGNGLLGCGLLFVAIALSVGFVVAKVIS